VGKFTGPRTREVTMGEGEGRERKGDRHAERGETKMPGFYREGQPSPWAGKFRVGGGLGNLKAPSALVCKICTSVPCPGSETKQTSLTLSQASSPWYLEIVSWTFCFALFAWGLLRQTRTL